ncbi:hypothetical protein JQ594_15605 [Bradyrhizobium manausense]|uniref:hypothetical protein n=1 Tax=Bradyrhizobium manausense TaxID=989370 RepID=UPI001BAD492A|nr:hypothetical protein [Bradyrhizobium manausense]MBR0687357.1 hypothetical protein [Bradyrhizobium manausense]
MPTNVQALMLAEMMAAAASYITFDAGSVSAVTLSNSNLTATNTGTTSTNQGAHGPSASAKTSGKFYFEITLVTFTGGGGVAVGVAPSGSAYSDVSFIPPANAITCLMASGNIWNHSGNSGTSVGTPANGDVICGALDITNGKVWYRKNNGLWDGTSGHDPTNPTSGGGQSITAGTSMLPYVTFGSGLTGGAGVAGNVFTANFGASAFTYAVPSGYTGWTQ